MQNLRNHVAQILHIPGMIILLGIAIFLTGVILYLFYNMLAKSFTGEMDFKSSLETIFEILLYIELVAAIKIYFQKDYHFPLRFFIYIGITDVTRKLIIEVEYQEKVFWYSISVLILIMALGLLEYKNKKLRQKIREDDSHDLEL